jgi:nitroreductase
MELQEAILNRRSIRKFTDEPVSKEDLKDIVLSGMNAPSGCNAQCWKFIVLTDNAKINAVADVLAQSTREFYKSAGASEELVESRVKLTTFFKKAPAVIFVFKTDMQYHDSRVTDVFTNNLGYDHAKMIDVMGNPELLSIGACVQNMLLTIQEKGLGACWQCDPVLFSEDICKALNVSDAKLASVIPVGVPAQTPREKALKPFDSICTID